jgi:hypothetical protein
MKNGKYVIEGFIYWFKEGKLHREDGPAVIYPGGIKECWYYNDIKHRVDGPAVITKDFEEEWFFHGKLHREDGPAIIHYYNREKEWWLNDHYLTKEDWWEQLSDGMKIRALFNGEGL